MTMEAKEERKKKQQQKKEKQRLQGLNTTLLKTNTQEMKKNGNCFFLSSASSVPIEGPEGCLGSMLPSSSSSQPKPASHLQRKPKSVSRKTIISKPLSTKPKSAPELKMPGLKPSSKNSEKKHLLVPKWQSGKKHSSKASQRSKLSAGLSSSSKNPARGCERNEISRGEEQGLGEPSDFNFSVPDNLVELENSTPIGKLASGSIFNYAIIDDKLPAGEDSNSANTTFKTTTNTPPVEASVSPEIQSGSHIAVATSTLTPVCYGAGHLISGVTDKRKCRSRGILTVRDPNDSAGFENFGSCEEDVNENTVNVLFKSRNSLIPLPTEASVSWLSSPLVKENEIQKGVYSDSSRPLGFTSICVSSSPSSFCQFSSDLVSDNSDKDTQGNSDTMTSIGKTRIVLRSPRRVSNCQGLLESSSAKTDAYLSATPQTKSSCDMVQLPEGGCSYSEDKNPTSVDHLSYSNVVQTPSSNTSSEHRVYVSWINSYEDQFSPSQGTAAGDYQMPSLTPKSQISKWYPPPVLSPQLANWGSLSHSTEVVKLEKKLDDCVSWISDSTLENMSLSQMRISWREGLASQNFDMDEFDCCICLSDEENTGETSGDFQYKTLQAFGRANADSLRDEGIKSPEFLEHEPEIIRKEKGVLSSVVPNICAESISTDASGLVASGDSDWTLCYKNNLFQV